MAESTEHVADAATASAAADASSAEVTDAEAVVPATAADVALIALARTALLEITREDTLGEPFEVIDEGEGVSTVRFSNTLPGYPGWLWTVSIAAVGDDEPTVLETELMPGDGSLLAPDWVPWALRLAEYEASQEALVAAGVDDESDDDSDDDDSDDDESDEDDDDESDEDDDDDDESDDDDDDESDDDDDFDDDDDEFDGVDVEEAAEELEK